MAKSKHTFAKRQREIEKKRKAEEKRARRLAKREDPDSTDSSYEIVSAAEACKDDEDEEV